MNKKIKLIIGIFLGAVFIIGAGYWYQINVAYRFAKISEGRVYKSGAMPVNKLKSIIEKYHIKTIIDLREPKRQHDIDAEHKLADELNINHFNIPSKQIPRDETVKAFLSVMDHKSNYPVLIHCYHGEGRAVLFSAIYRIEYEGWNNDKARKASRIITYKTSFSSDSRKGKYLINYVPRGASMKHS